MTNAHTSPLCGDVFEEFTCDRELGHPESVRHRSGDDVNWASGGVEAKYAFSIEVEQGISKIRAASLRSTHVVITDDGPKRISRTGFKYNDIIFRVGDDLDYGTRFGDSNDDVYVPYGSWIKVLTESL